MMIRIYLCHETWASVYDAIRGLHTNPHFVLHKVNNTFDEIFCQTTVKLLFRRHGR